MDREIQIVLADLIDIAGTTVAILTDLINGDRTEDEVFDLLLDQLTGADKPSV